MPIYCSRRPSPDPEPQQTKYQHWRWMKTSYKCVDNVRWKCNTVRLGSFRSYTILWFKNLVCYAVCYRTLSGLEQTLLIWHITETICDCDISIYAFFVNYYLYYKSLCRCYVLLMITIFEGRVTYICSVLSLKWIIHLSSQFC